MLSQAYGQTGSGKTHTLGLHASVFTNTRTSNDRPASVGGVGMMRVSDEQESGLVERALRFYLQRAAIRREGSGVSIDISLCMLEIYNDVIRDLLRPEKEGSSSGPNNDTHQPPPLELRTESCCERDRGGTKGGQRFRVYCDGATWINLHNETDAAAAVRQGVMQRVTGTTARNQVSLSS